MKRSIVEITEIDADVFSKFDYQFDGTSEFVPPVIHDIPKEYNLGVIYGSSGSGKSTLLEGFGTEEKIQWNDNQSVVSHFDNTDDAIERLSAVGLNSIPTWGKPRKVLSTGEG